MSTERPRKSSPNDVARFHADYDRHPGDHIRLFDAVAQVIQPTAVLYPGSYVDIAASVVFDDVTYVDTDKRARVFFSHADDVEQLVRAGRPQPERSFAFTFLHHDYREPFDIADGSVQLVISLYAGFISEYCTRYLAPGGWLLANNSHGDASMASLDPDYALVAVIRSRSGTYRPSSEAMEKYLVPKSGRQPTVEDLHAAGRGIAYTKSPYAYLFKRAR